MKLSVENANSVTGLIPAAGRASRLPGLTTSKELLPVPSTGGNHAEPAIASSIRFLLECGIVRHQVVLAPAKQDLRDYLGDGRRFGAETRITTIADSHSVPESLDAAHDAIASRAVVLVFPDIMFEPRAEIASLFAEWDPAQADALLALVPSDRGDKVDMVTLDDGGRVVDIAPKPGPGITGWTWVAAAWSPLFTDSLHQFLRSTAFARDREIYVGDVLNAARSEGMNLVGATFARGWAIDIGTPSDYRAAWRRSGVSVPGEIEAILRSF